MEKNTTELTVWQRIMSDSGPFWKKVELLGLALGLIVAILKENVPEIPVTWLALLAGISSGMIAAGLLAIKTISILDNPNATIRDYAMAATELPKQIAEIKTGITNTVEAIKTGEIKPWVPVSDTPIVQSAPVITQVAQPVMKPFNPADALKQTSSSVGVDASDINISVAGTISEEAPKLYNAIFEGTSPLPNASAMGNTLEGNGN